MKFKGLLTLTVSLLTATLAIALPTLDMELTGADKSVQTATMTGADDRFVAHTSAQSMQQ